MDRAEGDLDLNQALRYCNYIIESYKILGVSDNQYLEDKKRIEEKINLDAVVNEYKDKAEAAESDSRHEDAVREYELVLKLYDDMGIGMENVEYRNITSEIIRIKLIIEENKLADVE